MPRKFVTTQFDCVIELLTESKWRFNGTNVHLITKQIENPTNLVFVLDFLTQKNITKLIISKLSLGLYLEVCVIQKSQKFNWFL